MIKVYTLESCKDCAYLKLQSPDPALYELLDIGKDVRLLKEFIRLRDEHPAFEEARREGFIGIPSFLKEDGSVTLSMEEMGFEALPKDGPGAFFCGPHGC